MQFCTKLQTLSVTDSLYDQISKVHNAITLAAFVIAALITLVTVIAKIKSPVVYTIIAAIVVIAVVAMFLDSKKPIDPVSYTFTIDVKDSQDRVLKTDQYKVRPNPPIPGHEVSDTYIFNILKSELSEKFVSFYAESNDGKAFGSDTIKLDTNLVYRGTITFHNLVPKPQPVIQKMATGTFSTKYNWPRLIEKVQSASGFKFIAGKTSNTISLAISDEDIHPKGPGFFELKDCHPWIMVAGAKCTQIISYQITGTEGVRRDELNAYIRQQLDSVSENAVMTHLKQIISCLKK